MKEYSDVVMIGAGASGMLCAGLLGRIGYSVTILEKNERCGKKLLATGNGRCNYTNMDMGVNHYYGDTKWLDTILKKVSPTEVISLFYSLGILARVKDGYVYPYTNQAVTVVQALDNFCYKNGAVLITNCKVNGIVKKEKMDGYIVKTKEGNISCKYVVLATGGRASAELGGDASGYKLAKSLGHEITPTLPGLTGLNAIGPDWKKVAGTRIQGAFSLYVDEKLVGREEGEIQIVKTGVSGIPVFQLCRLAEKSLQAGSVVRGEIDFVPGMEKDELEKWLETYGASGLVPLKWLEIFKRKQTSVEDLKKFSFIIEKSFGMDRAQVTAGGVSTREVNSETLESILHKGLFFTGELLDIDGKCGGYNLHFAFATAICVAKELERQKKG